MSMVFSFFCLRLERGTFDGRSGELWKRKSSTSSSGQEDIMKSNKLKKGKPNIKKKQIPPPFFFNWICFGFSLLAVGR